MNILILGDSNSIFIKNFCKYVLDRSDNVCIFSYTNERKFSELYEEMGIKEVYIKPYFENNPIYMANILPLLWKKTKEVKGLLPFNMSIDIMHVHYVEPSLLIYMFVFWLIARKRILTFWGSDILRISESDKKLLPPFLYMASSIGFMISAQKKYFCDMYGNKFRKKTTILDFGNELLDVINSVCVYGSKNKYKEEFGLSSDKIIIHVGYNKDEEQQHIKILDQICLLPKEIIEKIQLVFPWGYGGSLEGNYTERIRGLLERNSIAYVFIKDFLQGRKLAKFRMSCDIFAYGQKTDAMSDSCLEYIYSGSIFLCPSWLWDNYLLVNDGEQCVEYSQFEDLHNVLYDIIDMKKYDLPISVKSKMQEIIYKNKSWKYLSTEWRKYYE